jgi:hypothetical protein
MKESSCPSLRSEYEVKQVERALEAKPSTSLSERPIKTSSPSTESLAAYPNRPEQSCRCLCEQLCGSVSEKGIECTKMPLD